MTEQTREYLTAIVLFALITAAAVTFALDPVTGSLFGAVLFAFGIVMAWGAQRS